MQNGKYGNSVQNGYINHSTPATSPTTPTATTTQKSLKLKIKGPGARPANQPTETTSSSSMPPRTPAIPIQELERELPPKDAFEELVPVGEIVDRIVQEAYSKLVELTDTYGRLSPRSPPCFLAWAFASLAFCLFAGYDCPYVYCFSTALIL